MAATDKVITFAGRGLIRILSFNLAWLFRGRDPLPGGSLLRDADKVKPGRFMRQKEATILPYPRVHCPFSPGFLLKSTSYIPYSIRTFEIDNVLNGTRSRRFVLVVVSR